MIDWRRTQVLSNVYHIHGDNDVVFPIHNVKDAIIIPGGTHIMLLNKAVLISQKLVDIIADN